MPINNFDPQLHQKSGKSKRTGYLKKPRPLAPNLGELRDAIRKSPRDGMNVGAPAGTIRAVEDSAAWKTLAPEQLEAKYLQLLSLKGTVVTDQAVADKMGWTLDGLLILLSEHKPFDERYHGVRVQKAKAQKLEARLDAEAPAGMGEFPWSPESRARLIETYVNTGSLFAAQKEVGCTPSQFNMEVAGNGAFSHAYKVARKAARATLRIIAEDKAINGDERLLAQLLKEAEEEGSTQLTDAQIEHRILGILAAIRSRIDPLGTLAAEQRGEARSADRTRGGGAAPQPEQVLDDLS